MPTTPVFDSIASEWEEYRQKPLSALELFKPFLRKTHGKALDAGCGNARNTPFIAQYFDKVICLDESRKMLWFARKRIRQEDLSKRIKIVKGDVRALPFPDAYFDTVFCIAVLHHFQAKREQTQVLHEIKRVLRKGGICFITVWNKHQQKFFSLQAKATVKWTRRDKTLIHRMHYFFEKKELTELCKKTGFRVKKAFFEKKGALARKQGAFNLCTVLEKT